MGYKSASVAGARFYQIKRAAGICSDGSKPGMEKEKEKDKEKEKEREKPKAKETSRGGGGVTDGGVKKRGRGRPRKEVKIEFAEVAHVVESGIKREPEYGEWGDGHSKVLEGVVEERGFVNANY